MTAKIVTTYFRSDRGPMGYERMIVAFAASVRVHSSIPLEVLIVNDLPRGPRSRMKVDANTHKLEAMAAYAELSPDDLLFLDCDMLVLDDPAEIFDHRFDAAYTFADYERYPPFNGGLLAFRGTEYGRHELRSLASMNRKLYLNPELHAEYRRKYQGMNQSAMGAMFEAGHQWLGLPMSIWNLCEPWPRDIDDPKILHCKARLMQDCLVGDESTRNSRWVKLWREYEAIGNEIGHEELLGFVP